MGRRKSDDDTETLGAENAEIQADAPEPMLGKAHDMEPTPARDRMRAFEDEHLGEDVPRIEGQVERGVGSTYHKLSDARKRHYEAIEAMIVAEDAVADARAKLAVAESNLAEAAAAADRAEGNANADG